MRTYTTPRRTCFCGSVNPSEVLRDDTGSRRFVIIHVENIDKDFIFNHMTPEWTQQLWRQVYETLYKANGKKGFYLTDEERNYSENANQEFQVPIDGEIELYDLLDWQADVSQWQWWSITELKDTFSVLKNISARKLGRAIEKIKSKDKRVQRDTGKVQGKTARLIWLPKKLNMTVRHNNIPAPIVEQTQEQEPERDGIFDYDCRHVHELLNTPVDKLDKVPNAKAAYKFWSEIIPKCMKRHNISKHEAIERIVQKYPHACEFLGMNFSGMNADSSVLGWTTPEKIPDIESLDY